MKNEKVQLSDLKIVGPFHSSFINEKVRDKSKLIPREYCAEVELHVMTPGPSFRPVGVSWLKATGNTTSFSGATNKDSCLCLRKRGKGNFFLFHIKK